MVLLLNEQSTVGKIDELCCITTELDPEMILLTDSWCKCDKYLPDSARIEFAAETEEEQSKHNK